VAWYKEWFGQAYLDLYAHRDAEEAAQHVEFVERVLGAGSPGAVLDLACGAGRHTEALRRRGFKALGLDLSLTLLSQPPRLPVVAGDMCCLPFADRTFDWVLNFFTSFGYFEKERENFRVLEEIRRVLTPGGRLLIDLFNRERVVRDLVPRETQRFGGLTAEIERWFDRETQRVNKRIRLERADGREESYLESVRAYAPGEVEMGMRWAGLEVERLYGGFEAQPFSAESDRLILVGRRVD
jgi:SAM-dependent methyltransferase